MSPHGTSSPSEPLPEPARRIRVTGLVHVNLAPERAFELFTPSGERAWAEGWDPRFPVTPDDETAPGTVFETSHGGRRTIWIVTACHVGKGISYARTDEDQAGTVTVDCRPGEGQATEVCVRYDLTALREEERHELARFAAHYDEFLAGWEEAIARALGDC